MHKKYISINFKQVQAVCISKAAFKIPPWVQQKQKETETLTKILMRIKNVNREQILVIWGFGTSGILEANL